MEILIGMVSGAALTLLLMDIFRRGDEVDIEEVIKLMEAMDRDMPLKERAERASK